MSGPTPTPPPKNEGEYARKLALAILSTLESKGLLTRLDVDTILQVAHRAANQSSDAQSSPQVSNQLASSTLDSRQIPKSAAVPAGPAALGTRWVKPGSQLSSTQALSHPVPSVSAPQPEQPKSGMIIPAPDETSLDSGSNVKIIARPAAPAQPESAAPKQERPPLVIDFHLE